MLRSPYGKIPLVALLIVALAVPFGADAFGKREPAPVAKETPGRPITGKFDSVPFLTTAVETTLVSFNFDNPSDGGPDMQGWTITDLTAQIGAFFHVDNFAGLSVPYNPISGAQSLWCGARPCAQPQMTDLCSYLTLPGYGNNWDQRFVSTTFSVSGDVAINFDIRYDSEQSYDQTTLQYSTSPGTWQTLETFQGVGNGHVLRTVPAASHAGSIQFRFRFTSDGGWSDEDGQFPTNGAAIIDNIVVSDGTGIKDSQNFEAEPVGFLFTLDFDWYASAGFQYGSHAALFDGDDVLQEGASINSTNFWGFFNGSNVNYACGGHAEQLAVPHSFSIDGKTLGLDNEVRSPEIPFVGVQPGSPVKVVFDVYEDLPLDNLVFYHVRVRSKVGGVWKRWRDTAYVQYGADKEWVAYTEELTTLIEVGATSIQLGISAVDMCPAWCGIFGSGGCHSHAPLIDNVRVVVSHDAFIVTNTNDTGAGSLREALTQLNASANGGVVRFEIPGPGPFVIPVFSALPTITKKMVIDGRTQPGYSGTPLIHISQASFFLGGVLDVSANECRLLGLKISEPSGLNIFYCIRLNSNNNVVQGCIIQNGLADGIRINGSDNLVGGTNPGDGNVISNVTGIGVAVAFAAQRNSILGNSIYGPFGTLGIDLGLTGATANDAGDDDTGANGLQNKPVLFSAVAGDPYSTTVEGVLSSKPNTMYRVEFFASDACNQYGFGDGKTFIGWANVFCFADGDGTFSENLAAVPGGSFITATATDPLGNTSEFSACLESTNTPAGGSVTVIPVDVTTGQQLVSLVFDQVTGSGSTTLVTGNSGPPLPGTFSPSNGMYYDLNTTATFTGDIEVCIFYGEGITGATEANLRLLHWDTALLPPAWVDVTTSLDVVNNTLCGVTDHLSPFVLATTTPTGVAGGPLPQAFGLRQNVPNPFNPVTTISYDVPGAGADVTIGIYDVSGRMVRTLVNEWRAAGTHQVTWDGRNASGEAVATGVYFYRMVAGSFVEARRMVLLK